MVTCSYDLLLFMLKIKTTSRGTNSMPFLVFRRDHLRSTSGIICGSGSSPVQFGDHFILGDPGATNRDDAIFSGESLLQELRGSERGFFVNRECLFLIAVNRERTKLFPVIRERKYSRDS